MRIDDPGYEVARRVAEPSADVDAAGPQWPMAYDISMGVRRDDGKLREELDEVLARRASVIRTLLAACGVPPAPGTGAG